MTETLVLTPPTGANIRTSLKLILMPASARAEAMQIWDQLETELNSQRLMCSAIWTDTWLSHFGRSLRHQFVVAYRGQVPCGICLLTEGVGEQHGPVRIRTWHIGTAGEAEKDSTCVEYNSLLVRPEDRHEFQLALCSLISQRHDWDEIRLDGFGADEATDWPMADKRWSVVSKSTRYFDLDAIRTGGQDVLSALGTQTRSVIRQNLRRSGPITCQWAETVCEAKEFFLELIRLHQLRWNSIGMPGCYSSTLFREFHLDLLRRLVPLGLMGLFKVSNSEGTIGCAQVVIDQNRACLYQGGRILSDDRRTSSGLIVDYLLIEECLKRGFAAVDFLAGDSHHRQRLSTHSDQLVWAICRRPSLKHSLIDGLRSVKRAFERHFPGVKASREARPVPQENPSS